MTEINQWEKDFGPLLNLQRLSSWTLDREREHHEDLVVYQGALAAFQAALRSQHVEGDGRWSAKRRARKVEKHLKDLVRASKDQAEAAEALRTSYAAHLARLAALPGEREAKALRRANRRTVGELTSKSLHKTASTMAPPAPQAPPASGAGQMPPAQVSDQIRGVGDLWSRGA